MERSDQWKDLRTECMQRVQPVQRPWEINILKNSEVRVAGYNEQGESSRVLVIRNRQNHMMPSR